MEKSKRRNFNRAGGKEIKNIHTGNRDKMVPTCHLVPFRLKNAEEIQEILVGITGVSNNERKLHKNKLKFKIKGIRQSLKQVMPVLDKID